MSSIEKIKSNSSTPTTMVYGAGNAFGKELINTIIEHGGLCIVVDEYTQKNFQVYSHFLQNNRFVFIEKSKISNFIPNLVRLDYLAFFSPSVNSLERNVALDDFLNSTNQLAEYVSIAEKFSSKFILIGSIYAYQVFMSYRYEMNPDAGSTYTSSELQRYSESFVIECIEKLNLDARIVRLGEGVGNMVDMTNRTDLVNYIKSAVTGNNIKIYNEGLDSHYFVNTDDGAFAVIKALFSKSSKGKIYNVAYSTPITSLELAYLIQDLEPNSGVIDFIRTDSERTISKIIINDADLKSISWAPKISLERSIAQSIDFIQDTMIASQDFSDVNEFDQLSRKRVNRKVKYEIEDVAVTESEKINVENKTFDRFRENDISAEVELENYDFPEKIEPVSVAKTSVSQNIVDENIIQSPLDIVNKKYNYPKLILSLLLLAIFLVAILIFIVLPFINRYKAVEDLRTSLSSPEIYSSSELSRIYKNFELVQSSSNILGVSFQKIDAGFYDKLFSTMGRISSLKDKINLVDSKYKSMIFHSNEGYLEIIGDSSKPSGKVYLSNAELQSINDSITELTANSSSVTEEPYLSLYKSFLSTYVDFVKSIK